MRRGPQTNDLRTQVDQAVVLVVGDVVECYVNRQGWPRLLENLELKTMLTDADKVAGFRHFRKIMLESLPCNHAMVV